MARSAGAGRATLLRWTAGVLALTVLTALAVQLQLIAGRQGRGLGTALWLHLGYFTTIINLCVAIVSIAIAAGAKGGLAGSRARFAVAASISLVGLTYSVALRHTWNPTGWEAVADHIVHDVSPLAFVAIWLLGGHGSLRWRDLLFAAAPPSLYTAYALARGALDGWYAYWFLNPARMSWGEVGLAFVLMLFAVTLAAALLLAVDRRLGVMPSLRRTIGRG